MSDMFEIANVIATGTNSDIDTSEEDIVTVTDLSKLTNTQASAIIAYSLGTNTSLTLRFYIQSEVGGAWAVFTSINESDRTLDAATVVIDASTPASPVVYQFPIPACLGFKITGQGTGGANSTATVTIVSRDN